MTRALTDVFRTLIAKATEQPPLFGGSTKDNPNLVATKKVVRRKDGVHIQTFYERRAQGAAPAKQGGMFDTPPATPPVPKPEAPAPAPAPKPATAPTAPQAGMFEEPKPAAPKPEPAAPAAPSLQDRLERARALGREAQAAGLGSAPALNPAVADLWRGLPHKELMAVMGAYTRAWTEAMVAAPMPDDMREFQPLRAHESASTPAEKAGNEAVLLLEQIGKSLDANLLDLLTTDVRKDFHLKIENPKGTGEILDVQRSGADLTLGVYRTNGDLDASMRLRAAPDGTLMHRATTVMTVGDPHPYQSNDANMARHLIMGMRMDGYTDVARKHVSGPSANALPTPPEAAPPEKWHLTSKAEYRKIALARVQERLRNGDTVQLPGQPPRVFRGAQHADSFRMHNGSAQVQIGAKWAAVVDDDLTSMAGMPPQYRLNLEAQEAVDRGEDVPEHVRKDRGALTADEQATRDREDADAEEAENLLHDRWVEHVEKHHKGDYGAAIDAQDAAGFTGGLKDRAAYLEWHANQPKALAGASYLDNALASYTHQGGRMREPVNPKTQYVYASTLRPLGSWASRLRPLLTNEAAEIVDSPDGRKRGEAAHSYVFSDVPLDDDTQAAYELTPVAEPTEDPERGSEGDTRTIDGVTYTLRKSNGGAGPLRWMREDETASAEEAAAPDEDAAPAAKRTSTDIRDEGRRAIAERDRLISAGQKVPADLTERIEALRKEWVATDYEDEPTPDGDAEESATPDPLRDNLAGARPGGDAGDMFDEVVEELRNDFPTIGAIQGKTPADAKAAVAANVADIALRVRRWMGRRADAGDIHKDALNEMLAWHDHQIADGWKTFADAYVTGWRKDLPEGTRLDHPDEDEDAAMQSRDDFLLSVAEAMEDQPEDAPITDDERAVFAQPGVANAEAVKVLVKPLAGGEAPGPRARALLAERFGTGAIAASQLDLLLGMIGVTKKVASGAKSRLRGKAAFTWDDLAGALKEAGATANAEQEAKRTVAALKRLAFTDRPNDPSLDRLRTDLHALSGAETDVSLSLAAAKKRNARNRAGLNVKDARAIVKKQIAAVASKHAGLLTQPRAEAAAPDPAPRVPAEPRPRAEASQPEGFEDVGTVIPYSRKEIAALRQRVNDGGHVSRADLDRLEQSGGGVAEKMLTRNGIVGSRLADPRALGMSPGAAYLVRNLMGRINTHPKKSTTETRDTFYRLVNRIADAFAQVRTTNDIKGVLGEIAAEYGDVYEGLRIGMRYGGVLREARKGERTIEEVKQEMGAENYDKYVNGAARYSELETLGPKFLDAAGLSSGYAPYNTPNAPHLFSHKLTSALHKAYDHDHNQDWTWLYGDGTEKEAGDDPKPEPKSETPKWERTGNEEAIREGGQIKQFDSQALLDTFGIAGVQYGNYMDEAASREHTQRAGEALLDLADVLGIDPKHVSMNGRLSIAFGARGNGAGKAHYEPATTAINMTKFAGGGSLAHEWGHFLDNLLTRYATNFEGGHNSFASADLHEQVEGEGTRRRGRRGRLAARRSAGGYEPLGEHLPPAAQTALERVHHLLFTHKEPFTYRQSVESGPLQPHDPKLARSLLSRYLNPDGTPKGDLVADIVANARQRIERYGLAPEEAMKKIAADLPFAAVLLGKPVTADLEWVQQENPMRAAAESMAKSKKNYWARPEEMFARAFESYVSDKVEAGGRRNTYLVSGVNKDAAAKWSRENRHKDQVGGYRALYPLGKQRESLNEAFDALLAALREDQTFQKALDAWGSIGEDMKRLPPLAGTFQDLLAKAAEQHSMFGQPNPDLIAVKKQVRRKDGVHTQTFHVKRDEAPAPAKQTSMFDTPAPAPKPAPPKPTPAPVAKPQPKPADPLADGLKAVRRASGDVHRALRSAYKREPTLDDLSHRNHPPAVLAAMDKQAALQDAWINAGPQYDFLDPDDPTKTPLDKDGLNALLSRPKPSPWAATPPADDAERRAQQQRDADAALTTRAKEDPTTARNYDAGVIEYTSETDRRNDVELRLKQRGWRDPDGTWNVIVDEPNVDASTIAVQPTAPLKVSFESNHPTRGKTTRRMSVDGIVRRLREHAELARRGKDGIDPMRAPTDPKKAEAEARAYEQFANRVHFAGQSQNAYIRDQRTKAAITSAIRDATGRPNIDPDEVEWWGDHNAFTVVIPDAAKGFTPDLAHYGAPRDAIALHARVDGDGHLDGVRFTTGRDRGDLIPQLRAATASKRSPAAAEWLERFERVTASRQASERDLVDSLNSAAPSTGDVKAALASELDAAGGSIPVAFENALRRYHPKAGLKRAVGRYASLFGNPEHMGREPGDVLASLSDSERERALALNVALEGSTNRHGGTAAMTREGFLDVTKSLGQLATKNLQYGHAFDGILIASTGDQVVVGATDGFSLRANRTATTTTGPIGAWSIPSAAVREFAKAAKSAPKGAHLQFECRIKATGTRDDHTHTAATFVLSHDGNELASYEYQNPEKPSSPERGYPDFAGLDVTSAAAERDVPMKGKPPAVIKQTPQERKDDPNVRRDLHLSDDGSIDLRPFTEENTNDRSFVGAFNAKYVTDALNAAGPGAHLHPLPGSGTTPSNLRITHPNGFRCVIVGLRTERNERTVAKAAEPGPVMAALDAVLKRLGITLEGHA